MGCITEAVRYSNYGDRIVDREGFTAWFNQNDITEADVSFAERTFSLQGRQTHIDEVTPVPLVERVSIFDTVEEALRGNWAGRTHTDEYGKEWDFQDYIEKVLLERSQGHDDFRLHEHAKELPPWPKFDQFSGTLDELFAKIEEDGFDYRQVLAYERQGARRAALIEALEERIAEKDRVLAGMEQVPA